MLHFFFKRKFPIKLGQAEENLFPLLAPSLILASPMTPGSPKEKAAWKNYCWCVILSDGLCTTSSDWKSPKSSRLKDQSATASEQKLPTFVCMVPLTNSLHIAVKHTFSIHISDMEEKNELCITISRLAHGQRDAIGRRSSNDAGKSFFFHFFLNIELLNNLRSICGVH